MQKSYRFLFIQPFRLPEGGPYTTVRTGLPKEQQIRNYDEIRHLLEGVEWELHPGALATYGNWKVENREEFCHAGAARLPIVREACESGKYNGIILLGGGEPGFPEAREISRKFGVVVTSCAFSQMHMASMLGKRFSVIDLAYTHARYYHDLVVLHGFADRCASIRHIGYHLPRPGCEDEVVFEGEEKKARRGEPSEAIERAVRQAAAAIEEDGAEVLTIGCSVAFWLQPFLQKRLDEMGFEVPVLEGYRCAIDLAKMMIDLNVNASGLAYPGDRPRRTPSQIIF